MISTQVNILEDALKDAQKKTMLEDYSVDPAALRRWVFFFSRKSFPEDCSFLTS